MTKIKLFAVLVCSLLITGVSKAQLDYLNPNDLDLFHGRTLIVIVEKPVDKVTEKLNKKHHSDKVDAYAKAMDDFNKRFADAVTKYWKVNEGEVQYKTLDEINDISDKKNYAVLFCRSANQSELGTNYTVTHGIWWWPDYKEVTHDKDINDKMTVFCMCLLDRFYKTPMYQFPLPDINPTQADLDYAVNVTNYLCNYRVDHRGESNPKRLGISMIKENQGTLKDKTLLLRRDWLDKKLTPAEMAKDYPFPYMIAGADTIARLVEADSAQYAVAVVAPNGDQSGVNGAIMYDQYAYNLEDGAILGCSGVEDIPSDPKAGTATTNSATKPLITKRTLLDFSMYNRDDEDSGGGAKKKGKR